MMASKTQTTNEGIEYGGVRFAAHRPGHHLSGRPDKLVARRRLKAVPTVEIRFGVGRDSVAPRRQ